MQSAPSRAEAVQAACRLRFDAFAHRAFAILKPGISYEWNWHLECMGEYLEASFAGEIKRLIINMPPRMLKSIFVAQLFPAWVLGKEPHHAFINASYAHSLAETNVVEARKVIHSEWYQSTFPETKIERDRQDFFTTTKAGQYKGTGIGGTVTGFGCKTLIIDDPISPKEANSDRVRVVAMDEIRSTLFSRFNNPSEGRMVLVMQRLHEADPTGELLKDGGCTLLKLPAIASHPVHFSLHGKVWDMNAGDYLAPARLNTAELDQLRIDLGEYNFVGQYMQEPVPVGGGEFKAPWIQRYASGAVKPKEMNVVILVDPAGGDDLNKRKKKLSDWTAMMVVGLGKDNNYYWLDAIRDRLNPTERVNTLFILHRKWNALCGKPPKVGYEKYGMMTDTHYIALKKNQDSYHFALTELGGSQMKEERIRRLIPDMQNGRWYFPDSMLYTDNEGRQFDLVKEMIDSEMKSFPRARFDDMLDSLSRVYEPDLSMTFPALQKTVVQRAFDDREEDNQGWEAF